MTGLKFKNANTLKQLQISLQFFFWWLSGKCYLQFTFIHSPLCLILKNVIIQRKSQEGLRLLGERDFEVGVGTPLHTMVIGVFW